MYLTELHELLTDLIDILNTKFQDSKPNKNVTIEVEGLTCGDNNHKIALNQFFDAKKTTNLKDIIEKLAPAKAAIDKRDDQKRINKVFQLISFNDNTDNEKITSCVSQAIFHLKRYDDNNRYPKLAALRKALKTALVQDSLSSNIRTIKSTYQSNLVKAIPVVKTITDCLPELTSNEKSIIHQETYHTLFNIIAILQQFTQSINKDTIIFSTQQYSYLEVLYAQYQKLMAMEPIFYSLKSDDAGPLHDVLKIFVLCFAKFPSLKFENFRNIPPRQITSTIQFKDYNHISCLPHVAEKLKEMMGTNEKANESVLMSFWKSTVNAVVPLVASFASLGESNLKKAHARVIYELDDSSKYFHTLLEWLSFNKQTSLVLELATFANNQLLRNKPAIAEGIRNIIHLQNNDIANNFLETQEMVCTNEDGFDMLDFSKESLESLTLRLIEKFHEEIILAGTPESREVLQPIVTEYAKEIRRWAFFEDDRQCKQRGLYNKDTFLTSHIVKDCLQSKITLSKKANYLLFFREFLNDNESAENFLNNILEKTKANPVQIGASSEATAQQPSPSSIEAAPVMTDVQSEATVQQPSPSSLEAVPVMTDVPPEALVQRQSPPSFNEAKRHSPLTNRSNTMSSSKPIFLTRQKAILCRLQINFLKKLFPNESEPALIKGLNDFDSKIAQQLTYKSELDSEAINSLNSIFEQFENEICVNDSFNNDKNIQGKVKVIKFLVQKLLEIIEVEYNFIEATKSINTDIIREKLLPILGEKKSNSNNNQHVTHQLNILLNNIDNFKKPGSKWHMPLFHYTDDTLTRLLASFEDKNLVLSIEYLFDCLKLTINSENSTTRNRFMREEVKGHEILLSLFNCFVEGVKPSESDQKALSNNLDSLILATQRIVQFPLLLKELFDKLTSRESSFGSPFLSLIACLSIMRHNAELANEEMRHQPKNLELEVSADLIANDFASSAIPVQGAEQTLEKQRQELEILKKETPELADFNLLEDICKPSTTHYRLNKLKVASAAFITLFGLGLVAMAVTGFLFAANVFTLPFVVMPVLLYSLAAGGAALGLAGIFGGARWIHREVKNPTGEEYYTYDAPDLQDNLKNFSKEAFHELPPYQDLGDLYSKELQEPPSPAKLDDAPFYTSSFGTSTSSNTMSSEPENNGKETRSRSSSR